MGAASCNGFDVHCDAPGRVEHSRKLKVEMSYEFGCFSVCLSELTHQFFFYVLHEVSHKVTKLIKNGF